jgi:hypothetical protein
MAIGKISIESPQINLEGTASIGIAEICCICEKCNNKDTENASIEFNFKEKKVYYLCSKCRHMNEMFFGKEQFPELPKIRIGR